MPEEAATAVRPRRQPGQIQCLAELSVDPQRGLMQVETLQASGRTRQCRMPVWPFVEPPRLAQRPPHLGTDETHIAFQIPQRHRVEAQALPFQPAQVIDQQVGIGALGTRVLVPTQEPIGLPMLGPLGPDDRPRPPTALPLDPLHPQIADHHSPCHTTSFVRT